MLFEFSRWGSLNPFYRRNDYTALEQWNPSIRDGHYCYHMRLHAEHEAQHERFAKLWDRNLRDQGFAEALDRQRQHTA